MFTRKRGSTIDVIMKLDEAFAIGYVFQRLLSTVGRFKILSAHL